MYALTLNGVKPPTFVQTPSRFRPVRGGRQPRSEFAEWGRRDNARSGPRWCAGSRRSGCGSLPRRVSGLRRALEMDPEGGSVRFTSLDPTAAYRLAVQVPPKRASLVAPAPVEPWSPHDDTVTLRPASALRGWSSTPRGSPCPARGCGGRRGTRERPGLVQVGDDGTFEIPHLPPGSIRLRADFVEGILTRTVRGRADVDGGVDRRRQGHLDDRPRLSLDVVIENWPEDRDPRRQGARAQLFREGTAPETGMAFAQVDSTGRTHFRGLHKEDRYTLWVGADRRLFGAGARVGRRARGSGPTHPRRLDHRAPRGDPFRRDVHACAGPSRRPPRRSGEAGRRSLSHSRASRGAVGRACLRRRRQCTPRHGEAEAAMGAEVTLTLQPDSKPR